MTATNDQVQRLLDEISRLLDAPATLESPQFQLIAFSAHDPAHGVSGDLDPVRMRSILGRGSTSETRAWFESFGIATAFSPVRTPAEPEQGIAARLCLPVRAGGVLLGYVWLLDDGHLDPGVASTGEAVALVVQLAAVLTDSIDLQAEFAAALRGGSSAHIAALLPARVVVGRVLAGHSELSTEVDGYPVHLVAPGTALRGGPAGASAVTVEVAEGYQQALFALSVPDAGPVTRWEDLGPYRMLRDVVHPDPVLDPLADSPELLHTLEVFLDHAGAVARAAEVLHIHRQTLYYRITRIEALTGCDLSDGRHRLLLHMSVKLARLGHGPHLSALAAGLG